MGLGVLEDKHLPHVPGTALLTDVIGSDNLHRHGELASALRHGKGKDSDVVLVPQPSNSPNDPLNWSTWVRDVNLLVVLVCGM